MIMEACTCEDGLGLPHWHNYEPALITHEGYTWFEQQWTHNIRLVVDWKGFARDLCGSTTSTLLEPGVEMYLTIPPQRSVSFHPASSAVFPADGGS